MRLYIGLALVLAWPWQAFALPDNNTVQFSNCTLALPGTDITASAQCGFLEVPENPEQPDGRMIRLHIAFAKATATDVAPDPVFFFAGGPGQAASETWPIIRGTFNRINKHRDIVMIDQRGTGQSNPLKCPPDDTDVLNAEVDFDRVAADTRRCLENLDGDPRYYTTTLAMQDYDRVRRAMGYGRINLVGVSYGTRAAQVYLRQFPDTVRTVILDSVVPMQLALGQDHARMLDRAVAAVLSDCQADSECSKLYPVDMDQLFQLIGQLRDKPRDITVIQPVTGLEKPLRMTADTLSVAIRFLSYQSETQAVLPLLLHEAISTGDLDRLATQAMLVVTGLNEMIAHGMELSVTCSEDYPDINFEADNANTIMGDLFLKAIKVECEQWPRGEVPADFHAPVTADTPVLLLSGERDPVTPPTYAARVAETFPNHLNLVARGQSHSVMRNYCMMEIASRFIEQGTLKDLDTQCVAAIEPSPFFSSLLGPDP